MRNFWRYNIGDEITTRDNIFGPASVYRVVERRTDSPTRSQEPLLFSKNFLLYTIWDVTSGMVSVMNERDVDSLAMAKGSIVKRNVADAIKVTIKESDTDASKQNDENKSPVIKSDSVNHPKYYQGKIEVIDFIEDKGLGFNLGNCVKYISRAGKKNPEKRIEDLKKARWYLDREINKEK